MNARLLSVREGTLFSALKIILIGLCVSSLTVLSFQKVSMGIVLLVGVFLYVRKFEDLFLFWLLTFSFFSIDQAALVTVDTHPIITYDRALLVIMLLILLTQIALRARNSVPINSIEVLFILLLLVMAFSIATKTLNKLMGARALADQFLLSFVVYLLAKNLILDRKHFEKLVNVLFAVGVYLAIMGIYEYFSAHDLFATEPGMLVSGLWVRVNGPYVNDTTFGVCTAICFFIVLHKYIVSKESTSFRNILYITVLIMIAISMFFTLYRGIWLAWALGLLTWFLVRRKGLVKLAVSIIVLAIIIIPFVNKIRSSQFYRVRLANVQTIEDRFGKYECALCLWAESPTHGIGFKNYSELARTTAEHNQIIAMLSETGLVGASVYIMLMLALLYHGIQNYKSSSGYYERQFAIMYLSIWVVYFAAGMGLNTGFDKAINFLFFGVAGCALNGQNKDRQPKG